MDKAQESAVPNEAVGVLMYFHGGQCKELYGSIIHQVLVPPMAPCC
jgi:hypothetical protein